MSGENTDNGNGLRKRPAMIHRESLDVNITNRCTNRCANCSHAAPFSKTWWLDVNRLKEQLDAVAPFLKVDMLHILGGEPLLHKDLPEIIRICAESKIGKDVIVITNGTLLPQMKDDFWEAINGNSIRISRYQKLNIDPIIQWLVEKNKTYLIRWIYHNHFDFFMQFRTNPAAESFQSCIWKNKCLTLHEGWLYRCAQSCFWPGRFFPFIQEGISLEGLTEEKLNSLFIQKPIATCAYCDASNKKSKWHEVSTLEEWIKDSTWQ